MKNKKLLIFVGLVALFLEACDSSSPPATTSATTEPAPAVAKPDQQQDQPAVVTEIADRYYAITLSLLPETAYFAGVELERHDGIEDNSPAGRLVVDEGIDVMLMELEGIDADELVGRSEWITHA